MPQAGSPAGPEVPRRDGGVATGVFGSSPIVSREYRRTMGLQHADYEDLLALRTGLRRFLRWSEQQAETAGLTPAQHQLLLAGRGHPHRPGPTVGEGADYLLLRHHSAVGLVDRAVAAKLVKRVRDPQDHRAVRLQPTAAGIKRLDALSEAHLEGSAARPDAPYRLAGAYAASAAARHRDPGLTPLPGSDRFRRAPRRPRYCRTRKAVDESWPARSGASASVRMGAALRHDLSELDALLVERVDAPDGALHEDGVLVEGHQLPQGRWREFPSQNGRLGRLPGITLCCTTADGVPSTTISSAVLPKASAFVCARQLAISRSCCLASVVGGLGEGDEVGRDQLRALVDQLVEGVLAVGARLAPEDLPLSARPRACHRA